MTDEQLRQLLQAALAPVDSDSATPRDAWPRITGGLSARPAWSMADTAIIAAIVTVLLLFPESRWLLALHL